MATVQAEPNLAPAGGLPPWAPSTGGIPSEVASPPTVDGLPLYRLSVEQYQRMMDHGVIDAKSKVVLIKGFLVASMGKNPPHNFSCDALNYLLVRHLPDGWFVSNHGSLLLPITSSHPDPDLKIVRGRPKDYSHRHVLAGDVDIVIEVADSSVRADQTVMKAVYAASAIPEYWVVNLVAGRVEVYTDPTGPDAAPDYRRRHDYGAGRSVPLRVDGRDVVQLLVDDILPIRPEG